MTKISGVIITFNEERNIARCIESIKDVVDEIVVVDSFSTDKTKEICLSYNLRFIEHPFNGYRDQKNFALDQAQYDYVLSLDADEALSEGLKKELIKIKNELTFDAYRFKRLNNYCGKWLKHGQWYPDVKTRLWNKNKARWGGLNLHERVVLPKGASVRSVNEDILHYMYATVDEHIRQTAKFAKIYAESAFESGRSVSFWGKVIFSPGFKFFKDFILKRGFLDGYYGFIACLIACILNFFKYINLFELQRRHGKRS